MYMDLSRPATRSTEPVCGAVVTSNSECQYPQVQRDRMTVQCPMEHCSWVGEAQLLEDHSKEKHPAYTVQPSEYHAATHMLVSKEGMEKIQLLQEEVGKLELDVTDRKMKLQLREKEMQKSREELYECEDKLQCCFNQIRTVLSQNTNKADPVIPQRSEVANQQSGTGGANSTASLGRASHPQPPPQERCSTLDANNSDYQQFKDMIVQEEERELLIYGEPEPQTEQEEGKEALAVGSKQSYPSAGLDNRPPIPPKPKTSQNNSSSSSVPPELPPKPTWARPRSSPRRSQQVPKDPSGDAEKPPPLPPKPGQAAQAVVPPQRRARRSPPPSTASHSTAARSDGDHCSNCYQLQEQNGKLQGKCDRLTCLLRKQMFTKNSNTCPVLFRDPQTSSRFRSQSV